MKLNLDLSSLAVILWCGMAIISGSIWVLASQVRKVADILEQQAQAGAQDRRAGGPTRTFLATRGRTAARSIAVTSGRHASRAETNGASVRR